jgi:hypothetical protein
VCNVDTYLTKPSLICVKHRPLRPLLVTSEAPQTQGSGDNLGTKACPMKTCTSMWGVSVPPLALHPSASSDPSHNMAMGPLHWWFPAFLMQYMTE